MTRMTDIVKSRLRVSAASKFIAGAVGALLDRALQRARAKEALDSGKFVKTKPFHKLPGYKGPKPPSTTDLERANVRAARSNTKAYSRSLAAYERGEGEHPHYQPPSKGQ